MKHVVSISLGSSELDFEFTARFLGERVHVRRLGTDGSLDRAAALIEQWQPRADAIGIGLENGHRPDSEAARLAALVTEVPVTTGTRLGEILQEWAVRHAQASLGGYFNNARVLFHSGTAQRKLALSLSEVTENLRFADPLVQLGVPKLLTSLDALDLYTTGTHYVSQWTPRRLASPAVLKELLHFVFRRAVRDATVLVAPVYELDALGLEELAGKTIVTSAVSDERLAQLREKGVTLVIDGSPALFGHVLGPNLLDAMIVAATGKAPDALLEDDYLEILTGLGVEPRLLYPNGPRRVNRFAFVIHPLSQEYFKKVKPIEMLSKVSPPIFMDSVEKVLAYAPPFIYSRVTGIKSPTGVEAEGWLISVGGTPKEIMSHSPEFTYRRLLDAAKMAKKLGAQIMGLGAFTKVVGDAGLTVARRAPLPITTGNSYSASGALWAAHDAMLRMKLLPPPKGKERVKFKAMVVGATGAIGAACSRLLVRAAEEVYLVSPETAKLLALKESILQQTPDAKVFLSARADRMIADMDMIVTATSGAGKKVLDITKVKPGCVITDVARPLDLPPEEVAKRPDVLVIESGEILLPGDVKMKNIGLPKNIAYACLAETIVLALEGRFENFTVGRVIEWEKVRDIYEMGLKHGMRLAAISGVNGVFTDADIDRVRELALAERARRAAGRRGAAAGEREAATAEPAAPARATKKRAAAKRATPDAAERPRVERKAVGRKPAARKPAAREPAAGKPAARKAAPRKPATPRLPASAGPTMPAASADMATSATRPAVTVAPATEAAEA